MVRLDAENNIVNFIPKSFQVLRYGQLLQEDGEHLQVQPRLLGEPLRALPRSLHPGAGAITGLRAGAARHHAHRRLRFQGPCPSTDRNGTKSTTCQDLRIAETSSSPTPRDKLLRYHCAATAATGASPPCSTSAIWSIPTLPPQRAWSRLKANFETLLREYPREWASIRCWGQIASV